MIYVHDPLRPLPAPPAYQNFSYYAFRPKIEASGSHHIGSPRMETSANHGVGPAGPFVPSSSSSSPPRLVRNGIPNPTLSRRPTSTSAARSVHSTRSKRFSIRTPSDDEDELDANGQKVPKYKRDFMRFHGDNGVRVVVGTFGPVKGVEMLLKKGYRHVYMSRHFARRNGLVPNEVMPGWVSFISLIFTTHS